MRRPYGVGVMVLYHQPISRLGFGGTVFPKQPGPFAAVITELREQLTRGEYRVALHVFLPAIEGDWLLPHAERTFDVDLYSVPYSESGAPGTWSHKA